MHHHRTETSKDECVGRLAAAFDAVLHHERLSIHVRAHLMEALAKVQSGVALCKSGSGEVRRELACLRNFVRRHLPASAGAVGECIEALAEACEAWLERAELVEADEVPAGQAYAAFSARPSSRHRRRRLQCA